MTLLIPLRIAMCSYLAPVQALQLFFLHDSGLFKGHNTGDNTRYLSRICL